MDMIVRTALGIVLALSLSTAMAWVWSHGEVPDRATTLLHADAK